MRQNMTKTTYCVLREPCCANQSSKKRKKIVYQLSTDFKNKIKM